MEMAHQKRLAIGFGVVAGLTGVALAVLPAWAPIVALAPGPGLQVHDLGIELMTRSMLIFETAGLSILVAMIAATAVAIARRRP
jgi:NADH:ubiquinone oxidoreductase subunit 6 (subunit J)